MELIKNKSFGGERPLFGAHDVRLEDITITDGESGIKCCQNIECHHSKFYGKYPWWHVDGSLITDCYFAPESRSAIWYSDNMVMKDCTIDGPKFFREMKNLDLENVNITDADETFWKVDGLKLKNVKLHDGTYPFMFSKNIYVDGLESDSKYVFQYCRNVEIHNAKITTKDSFWECENVTVYDSELNGSIWPGTARTSSSYVATSAASSLSATWTMLLWKIVPLIRNATVPSRIVPTSMHKSREASPISRILFPEESRQTKWEA